MQEKALQIFTDEYLEHCKQLSPDQIVKFLDEFRLIAQDGRKTKSKLISIKVAEDLLEAFKFKAKIDGLPYQTIIKDLMYRYLQ